MRNKIIAMVTGVILALGTLVAVTVAMAPAADAASCYRSWKYTSETVEPGKTSQVGTGLYLCTYSNSVTLHDVRFSGSTSYFRKLYDNGPDVNIQMRCGGSSTWQTIKNNTNYYFGSTYGLSKSCKKPAYFRVDLTADVRWYADSTYRTSWSW